MGRQIGGSEIGFGARAGLGEEAGDHHGSGHHLQPGERRTGLKGHRRIGGSLRTALDRQRHSGEQLGERKRNGHDREEVGFFLGCCGALSENLREMAEGLSSVTFSLTPGVG